MAKASTTNRLYGYISGAWVQLNDVQPAVTKWGNFDNGPLDLLAEPGEMQFRLKNNTGLYTPGGPSALAGFKRGILVKLVVTFEGEDYVRFLGKISKIEPRSSKSEKMVYVTCLDWLDEAQRHPIKNPGILLTKRSDEVMTAVLADMAVQPQQLALEQGTFTFPTALDVAGTKASAYTEFARIAFTDITNVYLRKDKTTGETLVLENDNKRHGWVLPDEVPLANADSGLLLKEDGDQLLLETSDSIILNETADLTFDSSVISAFDAPYGEGVVNRAVATVYPRRLDTSPQILFQLDEAFEIAARPFDGDKRGQNYVIEGTWTDADGGTIIGGRDIVTPVITTDYQMFAVVDGVTTATDISASLYIEFTFGTEGFTAYVANTNTTYPTASITKFNVRGTGIKQYNPVEYTALNEDSIAENEVKSVTLNQKYRNNLNVGRVFVKSVVQEYGDARTRVKSITFCANKSPSIMMAFLHTDVGHLRHIDIDELGIDGNYYVQGVEAKYDRTAIWCTWTVKEAPSLQGGFTDLAMEFDGSSTSRDGDAVDYVALPRVSNSQVTERTFAAWVNLNSIVGGTQAVIAPFADSGGVMMYVANDGLYFYSNRHNVSPGAWTNTSVTLSAGTWDHVIVCYNHTSANNDPIMYVNGNLQTITEIFTPSGTLQSELGTHVVIGNAKTATQDYTYPFAGKIYDPRIYDRIITAAEAATLYNSGTPDPSLVTDGLVLQGFCVRTDKLSDFTDVELDADTRVLENVHRSVGFVHGSPIARAAP